MRQGVTRRRALGLAIASLAVLALPGTARAGDVEVNAYLSADKVEVGEALFLEVEIAVSGGGRIGTPKFSNAAGLTIQSRGTSSGMSMQFGGGPAGSHSTKTHTYLIVASEPGEYELDIKVPVDGTDHAPKSKPKLIVEGDALADPPPEVEPGEVGKIGSAPSSAEEEIIVWPMVDATEVYVGQQLVYELEIWTRVYARLELTKLPTFKDFWTEELDIGRGKRRSLVAGVPYEVFPSMRRAVFPQRAGTLTIEAAEVRSGGTVSLFGGGTPSREHLGPSVAITVKPLPAEGQPAGFAANNVGEFTLSAEVDRTKVVQGEALRLSVKVAGTGNIALVSLGAWPKPTGMKTYEPKPETPELDTSSRVLKGERTWTMLLVAEQAGALTIPAIELPYFDPKIGAYRTAKTKPITIEVEANPDAAPSARSSEADETTPSEPFAPPLAGDALERTEIRERWLTPGRWWAGMATVPALLGLAWLANAARQRFGPDDFARARKAELARRRHLLGRARESLEGGEGFHAALAEALQKAAIDHAGPQGVGLARGPLTALLRQRGLPEQDIGRLQELLDACDAARFGAGSGDIASRREQFEQATKLLDGKLGKLASGKVRS
jgi:hypothetical protein